MLLTMGCKKKMFNELTTRTFLSVRDVMQFRKSWLWNFVVLSCILTNGVRASTPPTPRNVVVSDVKISSVKLSWNNGIMDRERTKSFSIFYKIKEEVGSFIILDNIEQPQKIILHLQPGTLYTFEIVAVGHDGTASPRSAIEALTLETDAPKITLAPRDHGVMENSIISFFCKASGIPLPRFVWEKDGNKIHLDPERIRYTVTDMPHGSVLRIEPVEGGQDNATFTCVADNGMGKAARASATLTVYPREGVPLGFPTIREHPELKVVEQGRQARMPCQAVALQAENMGSPEISWIKDHIPVDLSDPRLSIQSQGTLQIERSQESDAGKYECVAENSVGVAYSYAANLYVRVRRIPPNFTMVSGNVTIKQFSNVNLTCVAVGSPMPTVTWWEGEIKINSEMIGKHILHLLNVTETKIYTCIASSPLGRLKRNVEVRVKGTPPRNVRARAVSSTTIVMEWQPPESLNGIIQGYQIFYTDNVNLPVPLWLRKDVPADVKAANIENLEPDVTYHVRIRAYSWRERGPFSDLIRVMTRQGMPGQPRNLHVETNSPSEIHVSWDHPAENNNNIISYKLYCSDPYRRQTIFLTIKPSQPQYMLQDLAPNTVYHILVFAVSNEGEGPPTPYIQIKTPESIPSAAPQTFSGLLLNSQSIKITWTPPPLEQQNGILIGYKVYYVKSQPDLNEDEAETITVNAQARELTLAPLAIWTDYKIRISAFTRVGEGPKSQPIIVRTDEDVPSTAPQTFSGRPLNSQSIEITWTPLSHEQQNGILRGYKIYYVKSLSGQNEDDAEEITVTAQARVFTLASLAIWTDYTIWISAFTRVGEGPKSQPIIVRTDEDVPSAAPQTFRGRPLNSQSIEITWTPPPREQQNGILIGYKIYYLKHQSNLTEDDAEVVTVNAMANVLTLAPLAIWTDYKIWISAFTRVGKGPNSQLIIVRTDEDVPGAPKQVEVDVINSTSIFVHWNPPETQKQNGIILGYYVYYVVVDKSNRPVDNTKRVEDTGDGDRHEAVVSGLEPDTTYAVSVAGYTIKGDGDKTRAKQVTTEVAGIY